MYNNEGNWEDNHYYQSWHEALDAAYSILSSQAPATNSKHVDAIAEKIAYIALAEDEPIERAYIKYNKRNSNTK